MKKGRHAKGSYSNVFAQSVHIELASPYDDAQLSIHCIQGKSAVLHLLIKDIPLIAKQSETKKLRNKEKRKKAQHQAGFKPMTSLS